MVGVYVESMMRNRAMEAVGLLLWQHMTDQQRGRGVGTMCDRGGGGVGVGVTWV
jgi:hypothetical protein